ncbi:MAG: RDD family protein [Acidimicrobiia bacterium]
MEPLVTAAPVAGWYRDPSGRFELRYWDGTTWSEHVASSGVMYVDPPAPAPPTAAMVSAPTSLGEIRLASLWQRAGAFLLELFLMSVTAIVGWLVWSCFTFSKGQSPAKSLLGYRVVREDTGLAAPWSDMFLRNVVLQFGIILVSIPLLGLPLVAGGAMIFAGDRRQTAWDRIVGTRVVVDPLRFTRTRTTTQRY